METREQRVARKELAIANPQQVISRPKSRKNVKPIQVGTKLRGILTQRFEAGYTNCFQKTLRDMDNRTIDYVKEHVSDYAKSLYENAIESGATELFTWATNCKQPDNTFAGYESLIIEACNLAQPSYGEKKKTSNKCSYRTGSGPNYICNNENVLSPTCTLQVCEFCSFKKLIPTTPNPIPSNLVTACITYYRRPEALAKLLTSLEHYYPELPVEILDTKGNLSWARNELAQRCKTPYYFMLEEDMEITEETDIRNALQILEGDTSLSGVGGACYEPGREKVTWGHDFPPNCTDPLKDAEPSKKPKKIFNHISYQPCDLVLNFGIFRNSLYKECRWEENRPVAEHTEFFYRASKSHQFGFLSSLTCLHHRNRPDSIYSKQRDRAFLLKHVHPISKKQAKFSSILTSCHSALQDTDVEWFLSDGTLLGCHREQQFIEHDLDIDIGIFEGFDHGLVISLLQGAGFTFQKTYGTPKRGFQLVFNKKGTKLDIFTYHQEGNRVYHPVWDKGKLIQYWYEPFKLKTVHFSTVNVLVPENEEFHLCQQYGPDWRIPVKKWNWRSSPHNIEETP